MNARHARPSLLAALTALALLAGGLPEVSRAAPNILLITCDNLGYGDLPSYRPESEIATPNLDRLASQGARFTGFYTAGATCTVSRACLLTGRVPGRHGLNRQLPGIEGNYGVGLAHSEILLPEVLKKAPTPYVTGCFGKWNIGFAPGSRPTERGFDEFLGHASGNCDYYHHRYDGKRDLFAGTDPIVRDGEYATDLFAGAAIDFIRRHSEEETPWFCYLPFNAPHFPNAKNKLPGQPTEWQAPDADFEALGLSPDVEDPRKRYAAVVHALDRGVGRVLAALEEAGVAEDTFVFFLSDNGAFRLGREGIDVGRNDPLRAGGVTCWEGGVRVPAFARWPGHIEPGSVVESPFWSPDLFVACAELARAELPDDRVLDGRNPLPLMAGKGAPWEAGERSFYFTFRGHAALRQGEWKIVREEPEEDWRLFHLGRDVGETTDLADEQPERVETLAAEVAKWRASF